MNERTGKLFEQGRLEKNICTWSGKEASFLPQLSHQALLLSSTVVRIAKSTVVLLVTLHCGVFLTLRFSYPL